MEHDIISNKNTASPAAVESNIKNTTAHFTHEKILEVLNEIKSLEDELIVCEISGAKLIFSKDYVTLASEK